MVHLDVKNLLSNFAKGLTINGRHNVFGENKELQSADVREKSDPEAYTKSNLIDKILAELGLTVVTTERHIEDVEGLRKVDYLLKNSFGSLILLEAKPFNQNLYLKRPDGGVNQITGLFRLAKVQKYFEFGIATDGKRWIFIGKNSKVIYDWDLTKESEKIATALMGDIEVSSEKVEEEISEKFYVWYNALLHGGKYKDHEGKINTVSKSDCFVENITHVADLEEREQIAQTIIDRLIFIKFLQLKKIIDFDVLRYIFNVTDPKLNDLLRQLFFEVLNEKPTARTGIDSKFQTIPYLNGSLFLMTETERRNPDYRINPEILRAVIEFLDSFRFVHTEQEKADEKALDPEILGYIFERAMTASDRKGTGAYYTPKTITRYITENAVGSLIIKRVNTLLTNKGYNPNELINNIEDIFNLKETTLKDIYYEVLPEIKICDNACGSGAFLLAAAEFFFPIYNRINVDLRLKMSEKYIRRTIIKENLYGVDINPNAIEVAKLRLWLWLTEAYEPTTIEPLPNIEYNLRVGNTLFGYIDTNKFKTIRQGLGDWINIEGSLLTLLPEREKLVSKYKDSSSDEAREIKRKIEEFDEKIKFALDTKFYEELTIVENSTGIIRKRRKKPLSIKPVNEVEFKKMKPFHWGFEFYSIFSRAEKGFDVIIGNPPYGDIFQQKLEREVLTKKLAHLNENKNNTSLNGAALFIDRTYELLMAGGFTGYIVPNSITRIDEFNGLRNFILENTRLTRIIDEANPFRGVTLEMVSIFYEKISTKEHDYEISIFSRRKNVDMNKNVVKKSIFIKYKRFMLYWDKFYERIASGSIIGFLNGTRGISIPSKFIAKNKNNEFSIPVLISGKSVKYYTLDETEFAWGNTKIFSKSHSAKEIFDRQCLISTRLSFTYRVAIKPKGYIAADNVIRLNFNERQIDKNVVMAILNSNFMEYIAIKYLNNYIRLTMFINSITKATPIRIPLNQPELIRLVDKLIDLKNSKKTKDNNYKLEKEIKAVNQAINKQVYDLYGVTKDEQKEIHDRITNFKLILKKREVHPD